MKVLAKVGIFIFFFALFYLIFGYLFFLAEKHHIGINVSGRPRIEYKCGSIHGFPLSFYVGSAYDGGPANDPADALGMSWVCLMDYYVNPGWAEPVNLGVLVLVPLILAYPATKFISNRLFKIKNHD